MPVSPPPFFLLNWMKGELPGARLFVRLFQNAIDPTAPHVLGDFVEANYAGYARQEFLPAKAPSFFSASDAVIWCPVMVWRHGLTDEAANVIRGFYVVAVLADQSEMLIGWNAFDYSVDAAPEAKPFGFNVFLMASQSLV